MFASASTRGTTWLRDAMAGRNAAFTFELLRGRLCASDIGGADADAPKRWGRGITTRGRDGILLAHADSDAHATNARQGASRVGFFPRVDDFTAAHDRMVSGGVEFVTEPRTEPYGRVAVFLDISGNRWDLLGPDRP